MFTILNNNKKVVVILIIFLLGLYYVIKYPTVEGFAHKEYRCPTILIQKGSEFYLYNSKIAEVPGVNPLRFGNLEEYVEFTKWQRSEVYYVLFYMFRKHMTPKENAYIKHDPVLLICKADYLIIL